MKTVLTFLLLILYSNSYAHDHNLATYTVYKKEGGWLLKIDFTTNSVFKSIKQEENVDRLADYEFKKKVINYFKKNISLKINGKTDVKIGKGGIKLGTHSSQIIFILENFSSDWISLFSKITCFDNNKNQTNLIRVKLGGKENTYKKFLASKNKFQTTFEQVKIIINSD